MENRECDIDDILCQIEVLRSMRSLRSAMDNETFMKEFPELEGLDNKLLIKIQTTKGDIREALAQCGNIDLAEIAEFEGNEGSEE